VSKAKTKVIPLITGATGTISESFKMFLSYIPGKREIKIYTKQPYHALHAY